MTLKTYQQKRNFKKTTEPIGNVKKTVKKSNLMFVVQKHAASHLHYDFRLELAGVLISFAIPKGPCLDPTIKRLAVHVEDHPLEYGSFEGIIPEGEYGGGTVMVWDKGIWIPEATDVNSAFKKGDLTFKLEGKKLKGLWKLIQLKNDPKNWLLMKLNDQYAKPLSTYDITIAKPNSIISKKSITKIAQKNSPVWENKSEKSTTKKIQKKKRSTARVSGIQFPSVKNPFPKVIFPELATLVDKPPVGNEWLHEIKFDGYRFIAYKEGSNVRLMSRNNHDWTNKFPSIVKELKKLPISNAILDGEIVILDKKHRSDFQLLQNSIKEKTDESFIYFIFDLIYFKQSNLTTLPLITRKEILQQLLPSSRALRFSDHIIGSGEEVFKESCKLGLEGIVSKNINSPYKEGRNKHWLKIKCLKQQEFIIGGFTQGKLNRKYFGALLIGTYNKNKELIYHGHVGTGFSENSLKTIHAQLEKIKIKKMPFKYYPLKTQTVTWVKPKLIAEIAFSEWTRDDILRQPSFKGLRSDKNPTTITKEIPMKIPKENVKVSHKNLNYKLTNPEKILYAEADITKLQIAEYYEFVHSLILPYVSKRPLSLLRCPDGYQDCFYQKHLNEAIIKGLHEIMIKEKNDEEAGIYIQDKEGLLALTQMGVLEIHPWGSRIEKIEYPDIITFDLDPAPEVKWKKLVAAAFELKHYLEELKLTSFVKSTGGKGLHVVIPIKPIYDWEIVKNFTRTFVNLLVSQKPAEYTSNMNKAKRTNKIYIDYLRNQRGATAIAPYSTRAKQDAAVAVPLDWDELTNDKRDTHFTLKTLPKRIERLKKDPWQAFFKIKQSLPIE